MGWVIGLVLIFAIGGAWFLGHIMGKRKAESANFEAVAKRKQEIYEQNRKANSDRPLSGADAIDRLRKDGRVK